jgi:hypothetical protein
VRLFEHPDFDQAILRAAEHFRDQGLRPAIIEKDYFVTEALRVIAQVAADKVIFKGGTSLSKGWNLIRRFSEDIDLFLDPLTFQPPLGKKAIDRELKNLRDSIGSHTIGGFGRSDRFSYEQRFGGPGEVASRVLLESGTASGREPTSIVELRSFLAQFLQETGVSLGAEDESSFPFRLLHFRRTFVEKLFAIHGKVELLKRDSTAIGSYARHYYDLSQLAERPEILAMLQSDEYAAIKTDYDSISHKHFAKSYFAPTEMSFANSDAFFPPPALNATLGKEYEQQCRLLCYGAFPSWSTVLAMFERLKPLL